MCNHLRNTLLLSEVFHKCCSAKKQKAISKKQREMAQRVCQSAYGTYIRGVTTVAARYIGHPAVAIPASEMIKTMMEEAAPTVNYLVQLKAEPKKESNIKEEKKPRIDKHISGRFEYLKGCTNGWYTGFTKAIKGEQVIDEKYTLENLFSGNLTIEDIPDYPEYMTMVGATIGAKYRGLWNSAKGTYDGIITLATEPEKVLEVASDAILDFMEHPIQNTKELAGNIRDDVVDAVWRSTPQEISEDAGEILGDVLTGLATGGGGKAAAGGAKMAGNKLLALGKTGAKEFVEGLGDLGKIGAKNAVYVGATTGIENASRNSFINRLMMMASEAGDEAKKLTGVAEGATSKADDIAIIAGSKADDAARIAGGGSSVANSVTSTTGEVIENAVIGTPIVEGSKKASKVVKDEVVGNTEKKIERKIAQETVENKVVRGDSGKGKGDSVQTSDAVTENKVDNVKSIGDVRKQAQNAANVTENVNNYVRYTDDMKKYIYPPQDGYDAFLEKKYINIRKKGLDDISTIAKNTGLSEQEIIDMKKHVFLDLHELSFDGGAYQKSYFTADPDIAYAWEAATKGELNAEQKAWFHEMAKHELGEKALMDQGMPLRDISTYQSGYGFKKDPTKNAHDAAPKQPGTFPGTTQFEDYMKYCNKSPKDY